MADQPANHDDTFVIGFPQLEIPVFDEPTAEELARRRRVVARIHELREKIGSIGISSDDLLYESRKEDEE